MNAAPNEFWIELNGVDTIDEAFDDDTIGCALVNVGVWFCLASVLDCPALLLLIGRRSAWTAKVES